MKISWATYWKIWIKTSGLLEDVGNLLGLGIFSNIMLLVKENILRINPLIIVKQCLVNPLLRKSDLQNLLCLTPDNYTLFNARRF